MASPAAQCPFAFGDQHRAGYAAIAESVDLAELMGEQRVAGDDDSEQVA